MKKSKSFKPFIKMEKVIKSGHTETYKQTFHQHNEPILIENIDIDKTVVSNKVSFGKKGFK